MLNRNNPLQRKTGLQRGKSTLSHGRREFGERFVFSYYGNTLTSRSLDRPLGTVTTHDRWAVCRGDMMRMLTAHEYQQAMGFPADYEVTGTHAEKVKQLGNAVVPHVMRSACETLLKGL